MVNFQFDIWKVAAELILLDNHVVNLKEHVTEGSSDTIKNVVLELYGKTPSSKVKLNFLVQITACQLTEFHELFMVTMNLEAYRTRSILLPSK